MSFLLWALAVTFGMALVNGIACWFGLDVTQDAHEPTDGAHREDPHVSAHSLPGG